MVFPSFGNISTVEPPLFAEVLAKFVRCKVLFYRIILPLLGKRKLFILRTSFYQGWTSRFQEVQWASSRIGVINSHLIMQSLHLKIPLYHQSFL